MPSGVYRPPLAGVAVADLSGGPLAAVGRLLADLGADVTQVSWPGVSDTETVGPVVSPAGSAVGGGVPLGTAIHRAGLARLTVGTGSGEDGGPDWAAVLARSDILIESTRPGSAAEERLDVPGIRRRHPRLVIVSLSDFGRGHRFSRWQGTGPVFHALTSELSRSGIPGRDPLLPPGDLPYEVAAAQAAMLTVTALIGRLRTGHGNRVDFSVLDGATQALDPPFGMVGSAAAGIPLSEQERGRPEGRQRYPIFACADGYVRICVLSRRQWRGMFAWMGEPAEFADPRYDSILERFGSPALLAAIARFFAGQTRAVLEVAGQQHGVPTAAVLTLDEALATDQVTARGFLRETELAPGLSLPVPAGVVEIDGFRAVADPSAGASVPPPRPAPAEAGGSLGASGYSQRSTILGQPGQPGQPGPSGLPLDGIRVLDFGVIVVGGDTGRILGDLGADVIKVENSAFPDGSRGALTTAMSQGYAAGHRNKRSIGINLRDADGRALVRELAAGADIVLTNFKPGVIESLGLDYQALKEVNPGIVVVDSSAFGPTGPWARRLGYGPLVRAAAGFTAQWVYPGEPGTFSDAITVYPDHVCARIGVLAALSLLIRREHTGCGGSVSVAQSEVMLSHQAADIAARALAARSQATSGQTAPDSAGQPGRDAPWGLFPAAGDDDWIAVTVRGDADWAALGQVIGRPDLLADPALATREGRDAARARIEGAVGQWTAQHPAAEAMELLQAAGVPAGAMLRADDLLRWEYHRARRSFRQETHPHGIEPYVMENIQLHDEYTAAPPEGQAPLLGEQTAQIAAGLLGLSPAAITALIQRGVLEVPPVTAGGQTASDTRKASR